jgi:hypothetical protein
MKIICLLSGCKWAAPMRFINSGEWLAHYQCTRCGSFKTEVDRG